MTYLPTHVQGRWFHLYMILDLYSRKVVGREVHDSDCADHAAHLLRRTALAEGISVLDTKPVLHGDNGYAQALFRTAKYRPEFPAKGFADLVQARVWAASFVHWYNREHRHLGCSPCALSQSSPGHNPARWSGDTRDGSHISVVSAHLNAINQQKTA